MQWIEGHGLMLDPPPPGGRPAAIAAARDYLIDQGGDEWDVDEAVARARVERVWWSDELGFVQRDHADARAVVMVLDLPGARAA